MLNTHKIRGIDKNICVAEQMICYNIACMHETSFNRYKEECGPAFAAEIIKSHVVRFSTEWNNICKKYNTNIILIALVNGLDDFYKLSFADRHDYKNIGKIFYFS